MDGRFRTKKFQYKIKVMFSFVFNLYTVANHI